MKIPEIQCIKIDSFTLEYISRLVGKDIDELVKYFENEVANFVMDIKKHIVN